MSETRSHPDRPTVLVAEPLAPEPLDWLRANAVVVEHAPEDEGFDDALAKAHGLVVRTRTRVDRERLDGAPNLKVVGRAGVGIETIDADACAERGVRIVFTPGVNADAVAEFTIAMILRAIRPIATEREPMIDHAPSTNAAAWEDWRRACTSARSSDTESLGIVGLGEIGSRVARLGAALAMRVRYCDVTEIADDRRWDAEPCTLDELYAHSSVVTLHIDGRAENTHLVDAGAFAKMRTDVVFVNAARGSVVDEAAACAFARDNPDARLILDVHENEPFDPASPLGELANVTRTPHLGAATRSAKERMSWVVRDVVRVLSGMEPEHEALAGDAG